MRDSNPRGREPNPLSNPEDAFVDHFADRIPVHNLVFEDVDEPWRTLAVETPIETPPAIGRLLRSSRLGALGWRATQCLQCRLP